MSPVLGIIFNVVFFFLNIYNLYMVKQTNCSKWWYVGIGIIMLAQIVLIRHYVSRL